MGNSTILKEEQVWGNEQHAYLKEKGTCCQPTSLAMILGGVTKEDIEKSPDKRSWWWITSSSYGDGDVRYVSKDGSKNWYRTDYRAGVVRPALLSSSKISSSPRTGVRGKGWYEVTYGEYPTNVVNDSTRNTLERNLRGLTRTGKTYTFDTHKWNDGDEAYSPTSYDEYEQNGKRYVRIECYAFTEKSFELLDGMSHKNGDAIWLEVEPVKFAVDEKTGIALAVDGLYSGIQMLDRGGKYDGDFSKTRQKKYLDEVFEKNIEPSRTQNRRRFFTSR